MSSSEQAPEPTMDEILASIRKIISDDEPGDSPQPEAAAPEAAPAADDDLTQGLANALDEMPGADEGEGDAGEDILDLTQVVEDKPEATAETAAPAAEAPSGDALQAAMADTAPAPQTAPQPTAAAGGDDVDINSLLAEAGVQDTAPAADAMPPAPEPMQDASLEADAAPGETGAPTAEEASITEALSSLDQSATDPSPQEQADASMPEGEPDVPEAVQEEDPFAAAAAEEPAMAEATPAADDPMMAEAGPAAEPESEPAIAMPPEPEMPASELSAPEVSASEVPEQESSSAEVQSDFEANTQQDEVSGASTGGSTGGGSLEDSIKEMIRPMLREWINDNMERIVKDEVASGALKDQS